MRVLAPGLLIPIRNSRRQKSNHSKLSTQLMRVSEVKIQFSAPLNLENINTKFYFLKDKEKSPNLQKIPPIMPITKTTRAKEVRFGLRSKIIAQKLKAPLMA